MDSSIKNLQHFLKNSQTLSDEEIAERLSFLLFLEKFGTFAYDRANLIGQITASAWVFNPSYDKVLMIYHNLYKTWAWPGGHADKKTDLSAVAKREVMEETGVTVLHALDPSPIDVNILPVNAHYKKGSFVPPHLHYNVVYAFLADDCQELKIKKDENSGVCWLPVENLEKHCATDAAWPCYLRMLKKLKKSVDDRENLL